MRLEWRFWRWWVPMVWVADNPHGIYGHGAAMLGQHLQMTALPQPRRAITEGRRDSAPGERN